MLVRTPFRRQPMVSGRLVDLFDFHKYVQGQYVHRQGGYKKVCVRTRARVCVCLCVRACVRACVRVCVFVCVFPTHHISH